MAKVKGFDKDEFIKYLAIEFNGFENSFQRELVENLIDYANVHECVSKDQRVYWLSDIIPEITFGEVAMFMDDDCLTYIGQEAKRKALKGDIGR